ncbi:MFS transporter [Streptomyces sp. NPDC051677]|uniref:MFS transporter n=1 Tax=Streptomyces sp. NPDC051677 TaxID=3365669 RepID=UPI0037D3D06B
MVAVVVWKSNRRRVAIAVVLTAVFMANIDLWIVNVALVTMQRDIGGSLAAFSWVLNAYAVTLAALLVPAGRLGDRIGHRHVFLAGIGLFTAASAVCALSPNVGVLVAARIAQAAGAAAQLPTSLALVVAAVEPRQRMSAARGWAATGGLAAAAAPALGGALVLGSWRWVFLVNLPIGITAWLAGRRVLPRPSADRREPLPDLLGSALLIAAVGALTGFFVEGPAWGWAAPGTLALLAVALVASTGFAWRCRIHPHPMIEPALLRLRRFSAANAAAFLFSVAFGIMLLSNSLWCQTVWHYSALRTGLAMIPGPTLVPVVTLASSRLVHRIGPGPVAAAGSLLFAVSQLWRSLFAGTHPDYLRDLLPSMLISGVGVGLALSTLVGAAATALPGNRSATASAVVNSVRQVASALGVAVLVTMLDAADTAEAGFKLGWDVALVLALLAAAVSLFLGPPPATEQHGGLAAAPPATTADPR